MIHPSLITPTLTLMLAGCSGLTLPMKLMSQAQPTMVYALGERDGFRSPLGESNQRPACPALEFSSGAYMPSGAHRKILEGLAASWLAKKHRYLIAGYSQPELPEDYARSLSERRAQAVRQTLIECGVDASHLQTVGFGHDNAPTANIVVIYQQ